MNIEIKNKIIEAMKNTLKMQSGKIKRYETAFEAIIANPQSWGEHLKIARDVLKK